MRVVIAGASGFLGTHLSERLRTHGHEVVHLVRRSAASAHESAWDPSSGIIDVEVIHRADAVVNLAGVSIAGNPHSRRWAREVLSSRVDTTGLLARTIADGDGSTTLVAGNGISFYGDHGPNALTEESESLGDSLLTRVTRAWQEAAEPAQAAGARVCILRTAPVMDHTVAPLKYLRTLFRFGLGTRMSTGEQFMPMISLRDWVGAATFLIESDDLSGPFNLCCPQTPTNAEFTRALASAVARPAGMVAQSGASPGSRPDGTRDARLTEHHSGRATAGRL